MKVKEWVDGTLILDGDMDKGAEEAFNEGRLIEAFTLLQAQIDWWLAAVHQMVALKTGMVRKDEQLKNWDLGEMIGNFPFRFEDSAKFLRHAKVFSDKEYTSLKEFYEFRNLIIHRLVVRNYQPVTGKQMKNRNDVTLDEAKKEFDRGRGLAGLLKRKTAESAPFRNIDPLNPIGPAPWLATLADAVTRGEATDEITRQ